MQTLLDSGKYSDLSLRCAEKTWKVHCAVLCTSSSVFETMVDGGFKEAQNRKIDLRDDEPEIVEKMLKFMYQGDYDDERDVDELPSKKLEPVDQGEAKPSSNLLSEVNSSDPFAWGFADANEEPSVVAQIPSWSEKSLVVNAQMYIMGDKYDIGNLKKISTKKYAEVAEHLWNTPEFATSVKLLYDNVPQSNGLLRDVIAETAKKNIATLIHKQDFEDVMVSHGDLAVVVLKSVLLEEKETEPESVFGNKKNKKKGSKGFRGL